MSSLYMDLIKEVEKKVKDQCEANFNHWALEMKLLAKKFEPVAEGITGRVERYVEENKPCFYRNYREKLLTVAKDAISKPVPVNSTEQMVKQPRQKINFNELRDRTYLEAYFMNGRTVRGAADALGLAKSTFHDWLSHHRELVEAEERKTC